MTDEDTSVYLYIRKTSVRIQDISGNELLVADKSQCFYKKGNYRVNAILFRWI